LHPKFYKPIFFLDVKAAPNYAKKLIFTGIGTITLSKSKELTLWPNLRIILTPTLQDRNK
jgi:hypothetical protein